MIFELNCAHDPTSKRRHRTRGPLDLKDFQGSWTVLYFYPKDNTPGCTAQACNFRDALPGMNAKVIGVSADDMTSHEKFENDFSLPFPLASDTDNTISKAYGAYGLKQNYGKEYEGIIRSTFIIDPKGKIADARYNVKADQDTDIVQKTLETLQRAGGNVGEHA
jgi:thioredoxin-dependent peroxiredoxin